MGTTEPGQDSSETPTPPDSCDECGGTDFTPRTRPASDASRAGADYVFAFHECAECGARYNEQSAHKLSTEVDTPTWHDVFGHPEPYSHQQEAIPDVIDTALDDGLTLMEGGTGTGKTMIALTAGITLVRDPRTKYERVMVLTSVKQQLRQFEDDLAVINNNLADEFAPVRALTLVGKTDLCPYARESKGGITEETVTQQCRQLRDQTSALMGSGVPGPELRDRATVPDDAGDDVLWETAGEQSPYIPSIPSETVDYCPFYAQYKTHGDPLFTFGHADTGILDPDELVANSVSKGVCPHSAMSVLARDADVVIGNYYHAFDPDTLQITHPLIDDSTFLIADEAHMIEPRVRSVLSTEVPMYFIEEAANQVASVYMAATDERIDDDYVDKMQLPSDPAVENIQGEGIDPEKLRNVYIALRDVDQMVHQSVRAYLDETYPDWRSHPENVPDTIEIPLRDPTASNPDSVTKWAESRGIPDKLWDEIGEIGDAVGDALTDASKNGKSDWEIKDVSDMFDDWFRQDHTDYIREIQLEQREGGPRDDRAGWEQVFSSRIGIHSVMPRKVIGSRITSFGGGLLMSATLEPIDVYERVIGVDYFATHKDLTLSERTYTSDFPEENRLSISLDLPKYTYENRGDVTDDTETRRKYAKAIKSVAQTTPGNVMVCMPSYSEAQWAAEFLDRIDDVSKPVLLDQSSSEEVTQELKESFFEGDGKVLVTSLRGTLTEGVDYDGDKLSACIVCGVPIDNVGSAKTKAMRTAYESQFGSAGFAYGLTVPAVRKARQAFGRVIRGSDDVGVRVLADARYTTGNGNIRGYLSDKDKEEFETMRDIDTFKNQLAAFWESKQ